MRLYMDANVFISLLLEEVSTTRSLYSEAKSFFEKAAKHKDTIILSELMLAEIKKKTYIKKEELSSLLDDLGLGYEFCKDFLQDSKTIFLRGVHYPDCIHVSTAIKTNCVCIITFNKKDFEPISDTIKVLEPNNY